MIRIDVIETLGFKITEVSTIWNLDLNDYHYKLTLCDDHTWLLYIKDAKFASIGVVEVFSAENIIGIVGAYSGTHNETVSVEI